jgi:hypothetical protein
VVSVGFAWSVLYLNSSTTESGTLLSSEQMALRVRMISILYVFPGISQLGINGAQPHCGSDVGISKHGTAFWFFLKILTI